MVAAYRSISTANAASGGYTIARPTGITAGDVLVLAVYTDTGEATGIGTPTGWTLAASQNSGQEFTRGRVFVKTATGSEPSTYSLSHPGTSSVAILICVQDGSLPGVYAAVSAGSGNNVSSPSVTPSSASGIEIRFAGADGNGNNRTFTPPATYTEPTGADLRNQSFTHLSAAYKVLASASATGTQNHLASGTIASRLGFTVFVPSAATGTDATATPGVVAAVASIPAPTVVADFGSTATPAVVQAVASIPAPAVSTPGLNPAVRDVSFAGDRLPTLTVPAPDSQTGDLLIAHHTCDVGTLDDMSADPDWTEFATYSAGDDQIQVALYWRVADGTEPATWNFEQGTGTDTTVIIVAVQDAAGDEPTYAFDDAESSTSAPTPGITPPAPNSLELRFAAGIPSNVAVAWTAPAGLDEIADVQSTGYTTATAASRELSTTTPTGVETFTASENLNFLSGVTLGLAPGAADPGATATPAVVQGVASIPAPTASASSTASPSVVAATASIPAPTGSAGATASPSVVQATASIPAPSPSTSSAATPATVQAQASIPAVQASAGSTASPSTMQASASIPSPTVTAVTTASPSVVAAAASIPGPAASTGATANPDVVEATTTIPAPSTSAGATATAGVVSATTTIPAVTATTGSTASPATVQATASIPSATTSTGSTATPATVQATASIPAPGVSGGTLPAAQLRDTFTGTTLDTARWTATNNAGVTGSQDDAYQFAITGAAVAFSQLASADTYDLTGSAYAVELVDAGSQATGLEVYLTIEADSDNRLFFVIAGGFVGIYKVVSGSQAGLAFPAYDPVAHRWLRIREDAGTTYWEASPDATSWTELHSEATPITVTTTHLILQAGAWQALGADTSVIWDNVGGPEVTDATASPATVPATATIPAPTASAGATAAPSVVAASATIPGAPIQAGSTASPSVVAAAADIPEPDVSAGATAQAAVVAATATIPAPTTSGGSTASPGTVEATTAIPDPSATAGVTATPSTVQASATVPTPTVQAGGNATATPGAVNATASIPGPAPSASSTATPTVVLATAAVPTPTATVLVAATPAAVQAYASIPAALISTTARPPVVAAVASIPTPSVSTGDLPQEIDITVGAPTRWWSAGDAGRTWSAGEPSRRWSAGAPTR